jgi:RNA polymerase sigma-70 factor (ECF subfamily)
MVVSALDRSTELARAASLGDAEALDELLRMLTPRIVRSVRLIVGPGSPVAEDAAQEALIDVVQGLPALRDPTRVQAWAMRLATRRAIKIAQRERSLAARLLDAVWPAPRDPPDVTASDLRRAFYSLPPKMRAVAVLRLYLGLTEIETADVLGSSPGTIKSHLHTARARLRTQLGPSDAENNEETKERQR